MLPQKGFTTRNILFVGGLVFALFQLVLPVFVHLIDLQIGRCTCCWGSRSSFLAYPCRKAAKRGPPSLWDGFIALGVVVATSTSSSRRWTSTTSPGRAEAFDLVLGVGLFVLVLEAGRRTMGVAAPIMLLALFGYIYWRPSARACGRWRRSVAVRDQLGLLLAARDLRRR